MTLGFTPVVEIYGDNAALLNERLLEWEHTDLAGFVSDQLKLTLDIEGLEGLPGLGGHIGLRVGYLESGLVDKGRFKITQRTPSLFRCAWCWWRRQRLLMNPSSRSDEPPVTGRSAWGRCFAS